MNFLLRFMQVVVTLLVVHTKYLSKYQLIVEDDSWFAKS